MKHTDLCEAEAKSLYSVNGRQHRLLHFCNPILYHISQSYKRKFTNMPKTAPSSRLGHKFLEFFKDHHGDELECRGSSLFGTREKHATHRYDELLTDVKNALDDLLGLRGSDEGNKVTELPQCMYEGPLCDLHRQICRSFARDHISEASGDHRTEPVPLRMEPGLTVAGTDAGSDRDDCDGQGYTSRVCIDEAGQFFGDGLDHDLDEESGGDLDEIEEDENGVLPSVDAVNTARYDREEVVQKHQVSQRHRQRIVVDDDDVRTLVSVSDDEASPESMSGPMQIGMVTQTDHATLNHADKPSVGSPVTPKNTVSSLQRPNDTHSARMKRFYGHYKNSPGPRTLKTVNTLSVDRSYDKDIGTNEEAVRRQIMRPLMSRGDDVSDAKAGFVYAFRDNELPLIKLGRTTKALETRKAEIERDCRFVKSMSLVAAVKVKAYKQLEKIIHQDLAPHRRFFHCACGESKTAQGYTRHQEYFEIDDNAALSTLQLWADFVERQPWDVDPLRQQGNNLKPDWHFKMRVSSTVEPLETHESHDKRVKRWRDYLGIHAPETEIEKGWTMSPFALPSMTQKRNVDAGPARAFTPDYTPSKPSRHTIEDVVEADESVKPERCSSESPKRTSFSSEPTNLSFEQDRHSAGHRRKIDLPDRTIDSELMSNGPKNSTASNSRAKSVPAVGKQASRIFSDMSETQLNASIHAENIKDKTPSAVNGLLSGLKLADVPIARKPLFGCGQFSGISFSPFWKLPDESSGSPAISSGTMSNEHQSDKVNLAVESDFRTVHETLDTARPIDTESLSPQKAQSPVTMMITSTHVQSMFELANTLLAKEVQPLPARAISADIWQFRWPLACSIVFAIHSPHIPAGLSFLMWSIFLPFFVAELRGWTVAK